MHGILDHMVAQLVRLLLTKAGLDPCPHHPFGKVTGYGSGQIEKYEKEHYPVSLPDPMDAIRELMDRKALKEKI